jgi:membrane-associated phospholipid phosphatase
MRLNEQRFLWVVAGLLAATLLSFFFVDRPLAAMLSGLDPRIDAIAQRVTWFGHSTSYLVVFGALTAVLSLVGRTASRTRTRLLARSWAWASAYLFLVIAVSGLANDLVKLFAGRARPLIADRSWHPFAFSYDYQSFPSGHTAVAFGLAFGVMALWPRWRWPMLVFALAVGASRVILDVHHLADVIGGALVGLLAVRWLVAVLARKRLVFQMDSDGKPRRRLGPLAQLRHITPA